MRQPFNRLEFLIAGHCAVEVQIGYVLARNVEAALDESPKPLRPRIGMLMARMRALEQMGQRGILGSKGSQLPGHRRHDYCGQRRKQQQRLQRESTSRTPTHALRLAKVTQLQTMQTETGRTARGDGLTMCDASLHRSISSCPHRA